MKLSFIIKVSLVLMLLSFSGVLFYIEREQGNLARFALEEIDDYEMIISQCPYECDIPISSKTKSLIGSELNAGSVTGLYTVYGECKFYLVKEGDRIEFWWGVAKDKLIVQGVRNLLFGGEASIATPSNWRRTQFIMDRPSVFTDIYFDSKRICRAVNHNDIKQGHP